MAPQKLTIHVRPGASPLSLSKLLEALATAPSRVFGTTKEFLNYTESIGLGSYAELKSAAKDLRLIDEFRDEIRLSQTGLSMARLRDDARYDLLHYLMYVGWTAEHPLHFLPSWSYRLCCDQYWDATRVTLTPAYLNRQVEDTINHARIFFSDVTRVDLSEPSFSRKSLEGIKKWLTALNPAVIDDNIFFRRTFCSSELMLMGIRYAFRESPEAIGTDLLLSKDKRDDICRICLLEPTALDGVLDWSISVYGSLIKPGTTGGFYGRFVRLDRLPTIQDFVR